MAVIAVTTAWLLAQDPRRYGVSHEHRRTAQAREAAGRHRDAMAAAKREQHRAALQQLLADG
ncbi:MAG: hypothetical protein RLZZ524_2923, partial [Pseudomonadota bacterium]